MSDNVFRQFQVYSDDEEDRAYIAFDSVPQRQIRMRFVLANQTIFLKSYSHLMEVASVSHELVTLIFSDRVIKLKGRNLLELLDGLQDEKIKIMRCYRESDMDTPDADDPVIFSITHITIEDYLEVIYG